MQLIEISFDKLRNMLEEAAHMGALKALKQSGLKVNDEISQREAYRRFGESKVKHWNHLGLIKKVKLKENTSKVTYSLHELTSIESTLNVYKKPSKIKNHAKSE